MAQIRWTLEAASRLENIYDYIAENNPDAASRVVAGIYDKVQLLADFPRIGHIMRFEPEGDIRILLYGHYRIAYLVKSDNEVVEVLGVFHGAMDIDQYL